MAVSAVPVSISEEYYQISQAILESFPKYRLPLDLFVFKENIAQLVVYSKKDTRLKNEQVEEIQQLCADGDLFVSRADHPVYSRHIVKQLDLVLVDQNLKETEVADISIRALEIRLNDFFDQPVRPVFDLLHADAMVVTEYIWNDLCRLRLFVRRLHKSDYSLARHSINAFSLGLWLLMSPKNGEIRRKEFDQAALSLLLHDVGMAKIPAFITGKTTPLTPDEKDKISAHVLIGYKIMDKLEQTYDAMRQATLEHHERLDGSGYPQRTRNVSTFGKLVAVADAFSAMIQKRPYAEAKDMISAARELTEAKSRFEFHFSSKILAALVSDSFGKSL